MSIIKRLLLRLTSTNVVTCLKCADKTGDKAAVNFAIYGARPHVTHTCPNCGGQWIKDSQ